MHWLMPFRRLLANAAGRYRNRRSFRATEATITTNTVVRYMHVVGIASEIARRGQPHGIGLGKTRWDVKRTISWLHNFRRLHIRFECLAFIHEAFLNLACCIICRRQPKNSFC
jgi:transposase